VIPARLTTLVIHMLERAFVVLLAASLSAACGSSDPAPSSDAAAPPAQVTSSEVSGTVPPNAIVTLVPSTGAAPMPEGPAVMDQYAKQFVPNLLYVRVGQPVEFRNSEDMPHNVTVLRRGTGAEVFNVGTEPQQKHVHTFDRVGQFDVTCDIHPGMEATLVAADSPLATIAGNNGSFVLSNVALGSYRLHVTFEGRTVEQPLEVTQARTEVRFPS
jgi:plastocyanin